MNKRQANDKSRSGELSIGELRAMIANARKRGPVPSKVNPSLTLPQVCDILWAALEGRADDEKPAGLRTDIYRGGTQPSRDSLIIRNILRDCA